MFLKKYLGPFERIPGKLINTPCENINFVLAGTVPVPFGRKSMCQVGHLDQVDRLEALAASSAFTAHEIPLYRQPILNSFSQSAELTFRQSLSINQTLPRPVRIAGFS
jgi:hypothetical protein